MNRQWYELLIAVPGPGVDLVAASLEELGCAGVTVEERRLDTFVPPDPDEPLTGPARLRAYFQVAPEGLEALRATVRDRLAWLQSLIPGLEAALPEAEAVATEDWAEGWKQHFRPMHIGPRLVIRPSWEDFTSRPGDVVVILDPGMAFGTGTHGTTRLCLEMLAELFEGPKPPARVLDVGTGSGILAIAAAALGAERVVACDIEPEACRTTRDNARRNGQQDRIEVTDRPLEDIAGTFDLVFANILAEENIRLALPLVDRLTPAGHLVLSGILQEKEASVIAAFAIHPLAGPRITRREEWSCLTYQRSP